MTVSKEERLSALETEQPIDQMDYYEMDELAWLDRMGYHQTSLFYELLREGNGELVSEQQTILILTTIRGIYEQSHSTKIKSLRDYRQFRYWAYWTYGLVIYGTNCFCGNDPQMIEVRILPREVFNDISIGGLTDEELKKEYPELPEYLFPQHGAKDWNKLVKDQQK